MRVTRKKKRIETGRFDPPGGCLARLEIMQQPVSQSPSDVFWEKNFLNIFRAALREGKEQEMTKSLTELPPTKYVYAVKSDAFPGLIKIGRSSNVENRIGNLNVACAMKPFTLVVKARSFDNKRDERDAHQFWAEYRKEGEFFEITEQSVFEYFKIIEARYEEEKAIKLTQIQGFEDKTRKRKRTEQIQNDDESNQEVTGRQLNDRDLFEETLKRKREDLELLKLETEIRCMERASQLNVMDKYRALCVDTVIDEPAKIMFKDYILSHVLFGNNVTDKEGLNVAVPILISKVAASLGQILDSHGLIEVDQLAAKIYQEEYGEAPSKHTQIVDGRATLVNTYFEADRDILESACKAYADRDAQARRAAADTEARPLDHGLKGGAGGSKQ